MDWVAPASCLSAHSPRSSSGMCNLSSLTKGPQVMRDFARAMRGDVRNMPALPGIFPNYSTPIVRSASGGRELVTARWGAPSPSPSSRGARAIRA